MKRVQNGFGLVEMLIAMAIGLILLLGISAILMSMTRTSNLRLKMAEIQGSQRMAMTLLGNAVRYAGGFPYTAGATVATTFPAAAPFGVGQAIAGAGAYAGADTLSVRFVASNSATSSQGCTPDLVAGRNYTNVYFVSGGFLKCSQTDTTTAPLVITTVNLIAGVTAMNVQYGVDSTGGGFATQYLTATQATTPNLWGRVRTARVKLTFTNPLAGEAGQLSTVDVTQTIPYSLGL